MEALLVLAPLTATGVLPWPNAGPMPDEPVDVPSSHYSPVNDGTKSYRPIDPMPWGDVNKRVAPQSPAPKATPPAAPTQEPSR